MKKYSPSGLRWIKLAGALALVVSLSNCDPNSSDRGAPGSRGEDPSKLGGSSSQQGQQPGSVASPLPSGTPRS